MNSRTATWLAWSLAGLTVAIFAVAVVFAILALIADPSQLSQLTKSAGGFLTILPFFSFPVVGVLIASRRPENWIGWICLVTGLF